MTMDELRRMLEVGPVRRATFEADQLRALLADHNRCTTDLLAANARELNLRRAAERQARDAEAALRRLRDAAEEGLNVLVGCVVPAGGVDDPAALARAKRMLRGALDAALAAARGEARGGDDG